MKEDDDREDQVDGPGRNSKIASNRHESFRHTDIYSKLSQLDLNEEKDRLELLKSVDLIEPQKLVYSKPIAIVYNPNSGKKRNLRPVIMQRFDAAKIPYDFIESLAVGDTYKIGNELDLSKYSAIVVVGGDGSIHEVFNGMLMRKDG